MGPLLILIMSLMEQHTTWAIPMGNMVRLGMTRPGLWAGCTCCFLLLLQEAVVEETSVSKETVKLLFLFVSK